MRRCAVWRAVAVRACCHPHLSYLHTPCQMLEPGLPSAPSATVAAAALHTRLDCRVLHAAVRAGVHTTLRSDRALHQAC